MQLVKKSQFESALPLFEKSYDFFKSHEWIDKYRSLVLLSSNKMTYAEMALNNIAFCYSQIGNGEKAKEYYERILKEYPDNILAKTGLNFIKSLEKE